MNLAADFAGILIAPSTAEILNIHKTSAAIPHRRCTNNAKLARMACPDEDEKPIYDCQEAAAFSESISFGQSYNEH